LGPGASKMDVERHVIEIARANGIGDSEGGRWKNITPAEYRAKAGDELRLPGHTKDGAVIFKDSRGTQFTLSPNGEHRVDYADKTGYTRSKDADGNFVKSYFGPNAGDRYTVKLGADGTVLSNDRTTPPDRVAKNLVTERDGLINLASNHVLLKDEQKAFTKYMVDFEKRMNSHGGTPEQNAERQRQIAQTYKEISRILEASGQKPLTERERVRAALGVIQTAAEPTANDQGGHMTCQTSTIENDLYESNPAKAAGMVADIATTGKFIAHDGTAVHLDQNSLRAHGDSVENTEGGEGIRTYSSQLFQVGAINTFYTRQNENTFPPGDVHYRQVKSQNEADTGERITDYGKGPQSDSRYDNLEKWNHAMLPNTMDINYLITGRQQPERYLVNTLGTQQKPEDKFNGFNSPEEMKARLLELKQAGKLPAFLSVHLNHPLVGSMELEPDSTSALSAFKVAVDGHLVRITDYDPLTGKVKIDNQLGADKDHLKGDGVPIEQAFKASKPVPLNDWLDALEKTRGKVPEARFAENLKAIMDGTIGVWAAFRKENVQIDEQDKARGLQRLAEITARMSPAQRRTINAEVERQLRELDKLQ
jgi:hypothetical protein